MSEEKEYFGVYPKWLRLTVLPWYIWAFLIFTVIFATTSVAEEIPLHVLDKDGVVIRLMDKPCVDPVATGMILPQALHRFRAIESMWPEKDGSRKAWGGCWAELTPEETSTGQASFLLVFGDGEHGVVAKEEFKKTRGQVGV